MSADEPIASTELAQRMDQTWCQRLLADGYPCNGEAVSRQLGTGVVLCHHHNEGLDVEPLYTEDLDSLPLVEQAAFICSAGACGGVPLDTWLLQTDFDISIIAGDLARKAWSAATRSRFNTLVERWALAEAMLRNGEIR